MKRETMHHIVGLIGAVPLVAAVGILYASDGFDAFHPWNSSPYRIWIVGLPLLVGTVICLANSVVGLVGRRGKTGGAKRAWRVRGFCFQPRIALMRIRMLMDAERGL